MKFTFVSKTFPESPSCFALCFLLVFFSQPVIIIYHDISSKAIK